MWHNSNWIDSMFRDPWNPSTKLDIILLTPMVVLAACGPGLSDPIDTRSPNNINAQWIVGTLGVMIHPFLRKRVVQSHKQLREKKKTKHKVANFRIVLGQCSIKYGLCQCIAQWFLLLILPQQSMHFQTILYFLQSSRSDG